MKSVVIIPTYNEKENIAQLIKSILKLRCNIGVLIVDDNSPDGTGRIADELSSRYKEVGVIHRRGKLGLGTAYIDGFRYALKNGADYIFQMDADFSHNPERLPVFLEAIRDYDLVLGSRYVNGISVINWGFGRLLLSRTATWYVKMITGLPVTDATGGFKCFKREVLEAIDLDKIHSNGYSFQIEMTYKAYRKDFRIGEIPIVFEDRRVGKSKMSKKIVFEALWVVWRLQIEYFASRLVGFFKKILYSTGNIQFAKFCVVGGIGFFVNIEIFYVANKILNLNYIFCAILAFLVAVTSNFILNKNWTFKDNGKKGTFLKYSKYVLTNMIGLGVNLIVLAGLVNLMDLYPLVSQMIAVIAGMGFNFAGSKLWVFGVKKKREEVLLHP